MITVVCNTAYSLVLHFLKQWNCRVQRVKENKRWEAGSWMRGSYHASCVAYWVLYVWPSFSPAKQQPDISCQTIIVDFLMTDLWVLKNLVMSTICHPGRKLIMIPHQFQVVTLFFCTCLHYLILALYGCLGWLNLSFIIDLNLSFIIDLWTMKYLVGEKKRTTGLFGWSY